MARGSPVRANSFFDTLAVAASCRSSNSALSVIAVRGGARPFRCVDYSFSIFSDSASEKGSCSLTSIVQSGNSGQAAQLIENKDRSPPISRLDLYRFCLFPTSKLQTAILRAGIVPHLDQNPVSLRE